MNLLSNLRNKYSDLLNPVQQGLSQVGNAVKQDFNRSNIGRTLQAPQVQNFVRPIQQGARKVVTEQIPSAQRFVPLFQPVQNPFAFGSALTQQIGNFRNNGLKKGTQNFAMDALNSGKLAANILGAPKLLAKGGVAALGINAGLGGGLNKAFGGSFFEGAGQGVAMTPSILGITGVTNPLIEKYTSMLAPKIAPKLVNNPVGNYLTTSTLRGLQNIPEGAVIDATLNRRPLGAASVGLDFASGFLGKGTNLRGANIDANAKVPRMHPDDINDTSEALTNLLTNKSAQYDISGARKRDEEFIRGIAGHYISKEFAKQKSFQVVAQEVKNRLRESLNRDAVELPNLGMGIVGKPNVAQAGGETKLYDTLNKLDNETLKSSLDSLKSAGAENSPAYKVGKEILDSRPQQTANNLVVGSKEWQDFYNKQTPNEVVKPKVTLQEGRANLVLDKKIRYNGKVMTRSEYIDALKNDGYVATQHTVNGKTSYAMKSPNGDYYDVSKIEYTKSLSPQPHVAQPPIDDIRAKGNKVVVDGFGGMKLPVEIVGKTDSGRLQVKLLADTSLGKAGEIKKIGSEYISSNHHQDVADLINAIKTEGNLPKQRVDLRAVRPLSDTLSSSQPPVTDIAQKSFTQKGAMPEQQTGIAVRQPTELVPTTNSQKYVDFSKQEQQGLVPLEQSPLQQQRLSGGEQPPIRPPKQLAVGSGQIDPKQSSNTIIDSVRNKVNKIYTETLDRFHPLSSIANKAGEDTAMRRALTGHYGAGSTAQYHIDYELAPILKSTDVGELRKAAIAMRDAELKSRGIKGSNTDALSDLMSKQGKNGLKDPEMGIALKKLYKYQDDLVKKYLVGTEIMTQKAYSEMKSKNQFYIPFKRVMDDVDEWLGATPQKTGVGSVGSQNVIKKIKGSDRDIQDPLESIIENTYKIVGLAKRQEVAQTLASLETKLPKGTITKAFGKNLNPNNYFSVFEKGKAVHYKAPSDVIESAKGLNQDQISTIVKILAAPTRVFRATATGLNPEFMLPNVTRDLQSAFVNIGLNPLRFVSGLSHYMKRDQVYQDFLKSGGLTSQVSLDRPYLKKTVGEISSNKRGISVLKGGNLIDILAKVGQASEQPTRLAAFQKTLNDSLKKGIPRDQALQDAAYAAQESTINFGRRGSKTQSVNMIYAFMNARAQGTDRLIRSLKSDPKGAGLRMGMLTIAPAIGLYAYNRGFQSYNDERIVPPYEKENNFIIMLSDTPIEALGGAQYVKIPKGDIGKLANPIEQFMSFADGKGGDVQSSLLSTLKAFSPATNIGDVVPTALRPAVENAANYNFFQKRAIVSESKENYPAKFQFNKNTSAIYKEIGSRLNVSPSKVENIVRGYLTGFARIGEMIAKPLEKEDKYSGQDINQTPVARRFLGGAVRTEDEQELNNYFEQKGVMNKVQDIKTGIKYGNIPVEDGLNEINKLLETNEKELQTKPQSNFGVKASNAASSADVMRQEIEDSQLKLRVEMSGKAEYNSQGDIVYVNENGNAATLKLTPPTQGQGIGAFVNQNWNITKAREVWNAEGISKEKKDAAFKQLGVKSEDVRYDALANYSNDIKSQYLSSKSGSKDELIKNILTGRKRSIGDNIFASDGVLDSLVDAGKLTKDEAKALKKIDYNKDGTLKGTVGKGKKVKIPKVKAISINFKKGKRIKVKAYKPKKVKQYKLAKVSKLKKVKRLKA